MPPLRPAPRSLVAVLLPAALLAACDDEGLGRVDGKITAEELIDFGNVQVGLIATRALEIKNVGSIGVRVTRIEAGKGEGRFLLSVNEDSFGVAPQATHTVRVSFQPLELMEQPVESQIDFVSDVQAGSGLLTVRVRVLGRGIDEGLLIEPNPLAFGAVLVGSSRTLDLKLTNLLSEAVDVQSALTATGLPDIAVQGGTYGRFELLNPLGAGGSILEGNLLQPMQSHSVQIRYTPDAVDDGRPDSARWTLKNCDNSLCEQDVRMSGMGTRSGLQCAPAMLDFGAINPGRRGTRTVTCENISTGDVTVVGWGAAAGSAPEFAATSFAGAPMLVTPGMSFSAEVYFDPRLTTLGTQVTGTFEVRSQSEGRDLDPAQVALVGSGGGPTIAVLPPSLDFGRIAIGTTHAKRLVVENSGYSDLLVTMIAPAGANAADFAADRGSFTLATGTATVVTVSFSPTLEIDETAELLISSNDGSTPVVHVPLTGTGLALPPCNYTLQPSTVSFGVVPINQTATQTVRIQNNGATDCLVNDVVLSGDPAFSLVNGAETGIVIAGGAAKDLPINYVPPAAQNHSATLSFYISDPSSSTGSVPVFGVGLAQTQITCPAPITVPAGTPAVLTMGANTMGTTIQTWAWSITSAPAGGIGTPNQWTPNPPQAQTESFLPYIVGTYVIHVTVLDSAGTTLSCDTQVIAEGHGLRVQLTWNGTGDVDLHVHNGSLLPWFTNPDDCYYGNTTPLWNPLQAAATGENPQLDFDNTSGNGPENTRVDTVVIGQAYTIGVHNFARSAGRIATLDIFCGGVTAPNQTFTSPVLAGAAGGNCSGNDFWKVATVTFTSQTTCTITPINTIVTSQDACTTL